MDPLALAGLVKRLYPNFNLDSFDNRLKLQKFVFILRSQGIDFGYEFNLYLRGPYSLDLTRDAFHIDNWNNIQKVRFDHDTQESDFQQILDKLEPYKNDVDWLEIAATLLFLKELHRKDPKELLFLHFTQLKPQFAQAEVIQAHSDLEKKEMI